MNTFPRLLIILLPPDPSPWPAPAPALNIDVGGTNTMLILIGSLLLLIGAIGGGFEVRELRIPRVGVLPRLITGVCGLLFVTMGVVIGWTDSDPLPRPTTDVQVVRPEVQPPQPLAALPAPRFVEDRLDVPPASVPDLSPSQLDAITAAIVAADIAEAQALWYGDPAYLDGWYAGDALAVEQAGVARAVEDGLATLNRLDTDRSYIHEAKILDGGIIAVSLCEYWSSQTYERSTGELLQTTEDELLPQTINFQAVDDRLAVTSVAHYQGAAFCDR